MCPHVGVGRRTTLRSSLLFWVVWWSASQTLPVLWRVVGESRQWSRVRAHGRLLSLFADHEAQAVSWGGHLITINDQADLDWIYEQFGSSKYLIGLNDIDEEDSFVWVSGQSATDTNWCEGEPNDASDEDVVVIRRHGELCWNDVPSSGPPSSRSIRRRRIFGRARRTNRIGSKVTTSRPIPR